MKISKDILVRILDRFRNRIGILLLFKNFECIKFESSLLGYSPLR